ncbi:MAG TPA: thioredoxin family protein [Blastocatellia bacterium]|nr:thioredoxin family protein [Blastocatellia bacterium]
MRYRILSLLFIMTALASAAAQTEKPGSINWSDSTRDVYIDGEIDRTAQVLFSDAPRRVALISPRLDLAVILDTAEHTVSTSLKEFFRFKPDHTSAETDVVFPMQTVGRFANPDTYTYIFSIDGRPVIFRSHTGVTGEISEQQLWETVPVWRSLMENYQPPADAVSALKKNTVDAQITVALGTWCSDSRNYVPKLMKVLQAAGNKNLKVKIVGIDSQFHTPVATIQQRRLINVPTVIVERDGREIGRIVETPASETMEEDLVAILNGKPNAHKGRWERGPKIASGSYLYKDAAGKELGKEQWELYRTDEGGHLLHSLITTGNLTTDVWHRVNSANRPTFVEVTSQRGDSLARTRYRLNEQSLTARLRGNETGVIEQTLNVPDRVAFFSPAIAAEGWEWAKAEEGGKQVLSYVAPAEIESTVGTLASVSFESKGEDKVRVPAGEFRARRLLRKTGHQSSEWWLHSELPVPIRAQANGIEYVLTSLEISKP